MRLYHTADVLLMHGTMQKGKDLTAAALYVQWSTHAQETSSACAQCKS